MQTTPSRPQLPRQMLSIKLPFLAILFALEENLSPRRPRALPYLVLPPPMEVEQVLSITSNSKVDNITNGDNVIIIPSVSTEEKEHINGAAETNHVVMITAASMDRTDGDDKTTMEEESDVGIAIARSASSNGSRQQDKKRGAFGLFRAMFMSFNGSASIKKRAAATMGNQKKAEAAGGGAAADVERSSSDVASWKNLVDGMRPPPRPPGVLPAAVAGQERWHEHDQQLLVRPGPAGACQWPWKRRRGRRKEFSGDGGRWMQPESDRHAGRGVHREILRAI